MEIKKLKRVVIKEELVALTGDFKKAIILNQMLYWSERVKDHDQLLEEELERIRKFNQTGEEPSIDNLKSKGWIYKTAKELGAETMIGLSDVTIRRALKDLIKEGFLSERNNPEYKWDKTKQFRVNLLVIQKELLKLGYSLEGYSLGMAINHNLQNEGSILNDEGSILQNEGSSETFEGSSEKNEGSTKTFEGAIPEITTKIKNTETIYKDSTTQFLACSDIKENAKTFNQVEIVEDNTHLILSKNQRSKVLLWDVIRLKKSIEIFKEQQGQYFALLEKIYLDNKNFVPKSNKLATTNNNNKPSNFANFTQRKYDYDKLEAQLLGWDTSDDNYEIGTIAPTSMPTTANFTQRKYDYNKLEAQLLGWDTSNNEKYAK